MVLSVVQTIEIGNVMQYVMLGRSPPVPADLPQAP